MEQRREHNKKIVEDMVKKYVGHKKFDLVGSLMAHEDGSLDEKGTRQLFRYLSRTGLASKLQGHYGRTLEAMHNSGFIKRPKEETED